MVLTYKKLTALTFAEAQILFNKGFEGYKIPMNLSMEQFLNRFGSEGLSAELSIAAFDGEVPVGFVLQGIREDGGLKISWNGGTGIIPEYRGKQIGYLLIKESEKILVENEVGVATLEALSGNVPAIRLYEKCGYQIDDNLVFLSGKGKLVKELPKLGNYELEYFPAFQAMGSELFPAVVPWQTAPSIVPKVGGEVVLLKKEDAVQAACLIRKRRVYSESTEGITLFQVSGSANPEEIELLLAHALEYDRDLARSTYNFSTGNGTVVNLLHASGFEETPISQVFMTKKI